MNPKTYQHIDVMRARILGMLWSSDENLNVKLNYVYNEGVCSDGSTRNGEFSHVDFTLWYNDTGTTDHEVRDEFGQVIRIAANSHTLEHGISHTHNNWKTSQNIAKTMLRRWYKTSEGQRSLQKRVVSLTSCLGEPVPGVNAPPNPQNCRCDFLLKFGGGKPSLAEVDFAAMEKRMSDFYRQFPYVHIPTGRDRATPNGDFAESVRRTAEHAAKWKTTEARKLNTEAEVLEALALGHVVLVNGERVSSVEEWRRLHKVPNFQDGTQCTVCKSRLGPVDTDNLCEHVKELEK